MFCPNWIICDEEENIKLDCKVDMNTIIHDITYEIHEKR